MNTLVSSYITLSPPLTTCTTLPVRISPDSRAASSFSLAFSAATLLYERRTEPSPSFVFTTLAVIASPTCTSSVRSAFGVFVYSFLGITPSDL